MIGPGCMRLSTDAARDPARGRAVIAAALDHRGLARAGSSRAGLTGAGRRLLAWFP